MSRKAASTSDYFVPREGILERVLKHKLEELFGSKATYKEASLRDVSHGKALSTPKLTRNRVGWFKNALGIQRYVKRTDALVYPVGPCVCCARSKMYRIRSNNSRAILFWSRTL